MMLFFKLQFEIISFDAKEPHKNILGRCIFCGAGFTIVAGDTDGHGGHNCQPGFQ